MSVTVKYSKDFVLDSDYSGAEIQEANHVVVEDGHLLLFADASEPGSEANPIIRGYSPGTWATFKVERK